MWSHGMTNISIPVVNMLKNNSRRPVSGPINISIKFGFLSVHGLIETYFMVELRIMVLVGEDDAESAPCVSFHSTLSYSEHHLGQDGSAMIDHHDQV